MLIPRDIRRAAIMAGVPIENVVTAARRLPLFGRWHRMRNQIQLLQCISDIAQAYALAREIFGRHGPELLHLDINRQS